MRRNYLRFEIEKNSTELKKKMKHFYNLMSSFYNNERVASNNKLIFIRKNLDNLKVSFKNISEVSLYTEKEENREDLDIQSLCEETQKNLKEL